MNVFYVYGHFTKNTNELFYIGKGKGNRAYECNTSRSIWWHNIVKKHGIVVKILHHNVTENEALLLETQLIKQYGRRDLKTGRLVNMTAGGEGSSGRILSIEAREKMSLAKMGKRYTEEHKQNMSNSHKNVSDESRKKMSEIKRGKKRKPFSQEHKRKISEAQKNRHAKKHLINS